MRLIQTALPIAFLLVILLFAVQNTQGETLRFLNWVITVPTALVIVLVYLLGMVSGWSVVPLEADSFAACGNGLTGPAARFAETAW